MTLNIHATEFMAYTATPLRCDNCFSLYFEWEWHVLFLFSNTTETRFSACTYYEFLLSARKSLCVSAGYANISIVNLLGEQVARVFSGELDAGQHNFTFTNTTDLPDGMYECLVRMNGRVETLPMVLLH